MGKIYAVVRPRGFSKFYFKTCREYSDPRSPEYYYDYQLHGPDDAEVKPWVHGGSVRRFLMVTVKRPGQKKRTFPLHKLFAFNSPVCNPSGLCWDTSGNTEVDHGGRLSRGRNNRETNLTVRTKPGHRKRHRN